MSTTAEKLKAAQKGFETYSERDSPQAELYELEIKKLKKQLKKEEELPPYHPALEFGPVSRTVAMMAAVSLLMSVSPLPYDLLHFYRLFSTMSVIAVSIIWYGYNQVLAQLPKKSEEEEAREAKAKLAKLMGKPPRPDDWAHTRSHPSHFLTTRYAPPRLFPFPLGKTRPEASIKDELWWEGGNAPHVGHFKQPGKGVIGAPNPDPEMLMRRVEKKMQIENQQALWKKRIRGIQIICVIIMVAFLNRKLAAVLLIYQLYTTFTTEIENMLQPPIGLDDVQANIDRMAQAARPAGAPKSNVFKNGVMGMGYIYAPEDVNGGGGASGRNDIPIVTVPPHVLMTTESKYYAGPGEAIKGDQE